MPITGQLYAANQGLLPGGLLVMLAFDTWVCQSCSTGSISGVCFASPEVVNVVPCIASCIALGNAVWLHLMALVS